jgi:hypothetical protein
MQFTQSKLLTRLLSVAHWRWAVCTAALVLGSCGGGGGDSGGGQANNPLAGMMYYEFAGKLNKFDIATSANTEIARTSAAFRRGTFDVSRDGKEMLMEALNKPSHRADAAMS